MQIWNQQISSKNVAQLKIEQATTYDQKDTRGGQDGVGYEPFGEDQSDQEL